MISSKPVSRKIPKIGEGCYAFLTWIFMIAVLSAASTGAKAQLW